MGHDGTMIKKKIENVFQKAKLGSRHQRLFKKNVKKTKRDKE